MSILFKFPGSRLRCTRPLASPTHPSEPQCKPDAGQGKLPLASRARVAWSLPRRLPDALPLPVQISRAEAQLTNTKAGNFVLVTTRSSPSAMCATSSSQMSAGHLGCCKQIETSSPGGDPGPSTSSRSPESHDPTPGPTRCHRNR